MVNDDERTMIMIELPDSVLGSLERLKALLSQNSIAHGRMLAFDELVEIIMNASAHNVYSPLPEPDSSPHPPSPLVEVDLTVSPNVLRNMGIPRYFEGHWAKWSHSHMHLFFEDTLTALSSQRCRYATTAFLWLNSVVFDVMGSDLTEVQRKKAAMGDVIGEVSNIYVYLAYLLVYELLHSKDFPSLRSFSVLAQHAEKQEEELSEVRRLLAEAVSSFHQLKENEKVENIPGYTIREMAPLGVDDIKRTIADEVHGLLLRLIRDGIDFNAPETIDRFIGILNDASDDRTSVVRDIDLMRISAADAVRNVIPYPTGVKDDDISWTLFFQLKHLALFESETRIHQPHAADSPYGETNA